MWFWLSIIALLMWSGSDLFSKLGCRDIDDRFNPLKMLTAVGFVMGIHAVIEILFGAKISFEIIFTYLPVSVLYILSMAIGYLALRYIELSISSPICNSSGAVVAIIVIITKGISGVEPLQIVGIFLVALGVVLLSFVESNEDEELKKLRRKKENVHYAKSFLAILLPIVYCILDALGTYADSIVLEKLDEDSANVAYELTFFAVGLIAFIYTKLIKKQKFTFKAECQKYVGALCETAGQYAYIYALSDNEHVIFSAPIISAYCTVSVLWSRIFLKEKLSIKHYISIFIAILGIVILGIFDA